MVKSAVQGLAIFFAVQFVMNQFTGKKNGAAVTTTDASGAVITIPANTGPIPPFLARPDRLNDGAIYNPVPQRIAPMWPNDSPLDITIVVSPTFVSEPLTKVQKDRIVVQEKGFSLGNWTENRVIDTEFAVPREVQNNGTLWAHFYLGLSGSTLDPSVQGYDTSRAVHFIHPLTQYILQKKIVKTKNLLKSSDADEEVSLLCLLKIENADGSSPRKRPQSGESSPRITILTSPCHSSRIQELCISQLCIQQ
jgi:hypothetical protein